MVDYSLCHSLAEQIDTVERIGRVTDVIGLVIESAGPVVRMGEVCRVDRSNGDGPVEAEVVGLRDGKVLLMPLGRMSDIGAGCRVVATGAAVRVAVGEALLGRVVDAGGSPLDGGPPIPTSHTYPTTAAPPSAMRRQPIVEPLPLGIRAIDALVSCGKGQRQGIFSAAGVGKSVLLGMIARNTHADVNVIALIGERGREVRPFIEECLGEDGLKRSVVVVATPDLPAVTRIKAALAATAIAEYFRDQGRDVLLMMDSITRVAWAQREVGLAIGEPPTRNGYTPSVFALLPHIIERAGTAEQGSITGLYTVLVEGDDMDEPVSDLVRATFDGHIALSRKLAARGHYPAIDVLNSVSRIMPVVTTREHQEAAARLRAVLADYAESEDLINIGAYVPGSNERTDRAIALIDDTNAFLRQGTHEAVEWAATVARLAELTAPKDAAVMAPATET